MVDSAYFQTIRLYFGMQGISSKYLLPSFIWKIPMDRINIHEDFMMS